VDRNYWYVLPLSIIFIHDMIFFLRASSSFFSLTDLLTQLLTDNYSNFLYYLTNPASLPPQFTMKNVDGALQALRRVGEYINFWMGPLIKLSVAIIHETALKSLTTFRDIRVLLLVFYLGVLALLYALVLYPTAQSLSRDADKTKSLLLLLPPDVLRLIPSVSSYISDNISLEV